MLPGSESFKCYQVVKVLGVVGQKCSAVENTYR